MTDRALTLAIGGESVSAEVSGPRTNDSSVFVLAHGAGGSLADPLLVGVARALARRGHTVLRFNFLYREARRKLPDRAILLEGTFKGVLASMGEHVARMDRRRLIIGGKSMGGRIASHLVAQGQRVDGLLLLSYPLHPAKRTDKLRDAHLPSVRVPTLFVQGTRDPLCDLDLLRPVLERMSAAELAIVEGADHDLRTSRRASETRLPFVVEAIEGWVARRIEGPIPAAP